MPLTLKAFLSHRYQSPVVNGYFHGVFRDAAELQFDVDVAAGSTNVTRLERMVRDTDAFVGIYPYDGDGVERPTREQLLEASRYFRLELDLAARARTPAIIFVDRRYGTVMGIPPSMFVCSFDHQEVIGRGGSPSREGFLRTFQRFCENVAASMQYERTRPQPVSRSVGILLPPTAYDDAVMEDLEARITSANVDAERLAWPPVLDPRTIGRMQGYDWIVTDVGHAGVDTGVAAYLHGQSVPMLRLSRQASDPANPEDRSAVEATLYGGHQVGYPKDVIRWQTTEQLGQEFDKRLARILQASRRIGSTQEAEQYFLEAARRKEAVFLSYSGKDEAFVAPIAAALRRRFQSVFDYRDGGESIEPGRAWLDEIFSKLDRSAVAIPILSAGYIASGNCLHEARSMIAARDAGKIAVVPVKLLREDLTLPVFLQDVQYIRAWEHADAESVVERIIKAVR